MTGIPKRPLARFRRLLDGRRRRRAAGVFGDWNAPVMRPRLEKLEPRQMLAGDLVISEFLAVNDRGLRNDAGNRSDWIEIFNQGSVAADLSGYFLTDSASNLNRWRFPEVTLDAGDYLLVYASGDDRTDPGEPLHTNFRLSGAGEYLALVEPDGQTVAFDFGPTYPRQEADISYGLRHGFQAETLVESGAAATALVPSVANGGDLLETTWTELAFDDSSWNAGTTGVGYERGTGFEQLIGLDLEAEMYRNSASAYLRVPFTVSDTSDLFQLTLRMKYDDGFVAYLNGRPVAQRNDPANLMWNSGAARAHADSLAKEFEDIDITAWIDELVVGENLLAIHGLNAGNTGADFLILPELVAGRSAPIQLDAPRYFLTPSPNLANGEGDSHVVMDIAHGPTSPREDEDLNVSAVVTTAGEADVSLMLHYVVMHSRRVASVEMFDDGQHGDALAGDGIFGAAIPSRAYSTGQMVRYYVTSDDAAPEPEIRWPRFLDPLDSREFYGTVVQDPTIESNLPVMHLFANNFAAANTDVGTRASLYFDGELYDNIQIDIHGQSTRSGSFPRKSYDVDFNRDHRFRFSDDVRRMKDFNLLTNWADKTRVRNTLAYETFANAGAAYHLAAPVRVHLNGEFYSTYDFVEDGDDRFLERLGLDPEGALYKMYNRLDSSTPGGNSAEKKTRRDEDHSDLQDLIDGLNAGRTSFIYDNVNIPAMINFAAGLVITGNNDCCHKNYYAYRDTNGNREWEYLPWDVDLSFGHNWTPQFNYFDDQLFINNGLFRSISNRLLDRLYAIPDIRQMYLRRVRTLMDELLQPPGTPPEELKFERRIAELVEQLGPDVALDLAKWGSWGASQAWEDQIAILTEQYLPQRREFLYGMSSIPEAQATDAVVEFRRIEFAEAGHIQDEEFIQVFNPDLTQALDISGWRVTGAVQHTFKPGTVLPANGSIYLSPDVNAFRARRIRGQPSGGKSLLIQGDYQGHLPREGGTLKIEDRAGREVAVALVEGQPSAAQENLRVTELMYHPADPPAGAGFDADQFEFVELTNIGDTALDLAGVHFADGIQFDFNGAGVTVLEPGGHVLVVKNAAAFESRYGVVENIAGEYQGQLSNGGEHILLADGLGGQILDFTYNDAWHPATDGGGPSLVIIDVMAATENWGHPNAWRASARAGGSPGEAEPDRVPGDATGDGVVDQLDLDEVRNAFGQSGIGLPGDVNDDGIVDLRDLNVVRNHFGTGEALVAGANGTSTHAGRLVRSDSRHAGEYEYVGRYRALRQRAARGHDLDPPQAELWDRALLRLLGR